jgi:hypothetical protein
LLRLPRIIFFAFFRSIVNKTLLPLVKIPFFIAGWMFAIFYLHFVEVEDPGVAYLISAHHSYHITD